MEKFAQLAAGAVVIAIVLWSMASYFKNLSRKESKCSCGSAKSKCKDA